MCSVCVMEGGLNGTDCASIAQLSSVCLGDTADGEDVARPGVAAWLHHGANRKKNPYQKIYHFQYSPQGCHSNAIPQVCRSSRTFVLIFSLVLCLTKSFSSSRNCLVLISLWTKMPQFFTQLSITCKAYKAT